MAGVLLIGSVPALDRFCNILSRDGSTFMSPLSETVSWAVLSAGFGGGGPVLLARCSEEPLTLAAAFSSALLVVEGTPSLELDAQTKDLLTQGSLRPTHARFLSTQSVARLWCTAQPFPAASKQ